MTAGDRLTLTADKPVAGGRMLARVDGAVVLVSGTIPGERVEVEVEKVQRGTAWARTVRVIAPVPDRVEPLADWACGGNVLSHIKYSRQVALKRDILRDAFTRIARLDVREDVPVAESPTEGYRMRARLHVSRGRIGFFREGTHDLCDPELTGQLLPATVHVVRALEDALGSIGGAEVAEVELAENCAADQRGLHLLLRPEADSSRLAALPAIAGVTGVSCGHARPLVLWGVPDVTDTLTLQGPGGALTASLTRQAHAFFQGNRYLLSTLVGSVVDVVPPGRVLDLYAGVGLFSVVLAARGDTDVVAIEGDRTAAHDLERNASRVGGTIAPRHQSVEAFLASRDAAGADAILVDPPRTGMTKDALRGAIALAAARMVYVSCDVATLARDARTLVDAGYRLTHVQAFDLFPNTAHVETLAVFDR